MPTATALGTTCQRFAVHRDLGTVRKTLQRIRRSDTFPELNLFDRPDPDRMLDRMERLGCDRWATRIVAYVTPATFDGQYAEPLGDAGGSILAVTKDMSLRGIGFSHTEAIRGHYAIVTFELTDDDPVSLLLEIRWSNVPSGGAQMSGGMFIGVTDTPGQK